MRIQIAGLLTAFCLGGSQSVFAAEAGPTHNWAGVYIGGHLGGGWSNTSLSNTFNSFVGRNFVNMGLGDSITYSQRGFNGGGHIGYNWQTSHWVLGVEVSGSKTKIEGGATFGLEHARGEGDDLFDSKIRALLLATVRLGYAWHRSLFYVKGGYAGADVKTDVTDANRTPVNGICACGGFDEKWRSGGTVGGGWEYAWTNNWILGLQYDYARLSGHYDLIADGTGRALLKDSPRHLHLATARLSYKFGWAVR